MDGPKWRRNCPASQLPNDNYRANATFKVFLKEVSEVPRRGPQLFVSRSNAGLVVYLFENEVPEIQEDQRALWLWHGKPIPLSLGRPPHQSCRRQHRA